MDESKRMISSFVEIDKDLEQSAVEHFSWNFLLHFLVNQNFKVKNQAKK